MFCIVFFMQCFFNLCCYLLYVWLLVFVVGLLYVVIDWVDIYIKVFVIGLQFMVCGVVNEVVFGQVIDVLISFKLCNEVMLKMFVYEVNDLCSLCYCKYLMSEQFLVDYVFMQVQVDVVVCYLWQNGFIDIDVVFNWLLVLVCGMVGMVKVVFNMLLVYYQLVGCSGFVNSGKVQVLCVLGGIVGLVLGLQNVVCVCLLLCVGDVVEVCMLVVGMVIGYYLKEFLVLYGVIGVLMVVGIIVGVIIIGGVL